MRRLGWVLAITVSVALVLSVLLGAQDVVRIPIPAIVGVVVIGVLLFRARPVRTLEIGWSGTVAASQPFAAIPLTPTSRPPTGSGSVARGLARVEARELIGNPWLAGGISLWLVLLLTMGVLFVQDIHKSWWEFFALATMFCHPFAGLAIIAAHRNRTRSRRDGCDELFDACPAAPADRTLGHLATAWTGAVICVVCLAVFTGMVAWRGGVYGPLDNQAIAAFIAAAAIGAGAIALGVTLGRWLPWGLVPFAAVPLIAMASGRINRVGMPGWATDRFLATFVATAGIDTIFYTRPVWSAALWLLALAVVVGGLGVVGAHRRGTVVAAGAVVVALVAGLLVIRPASHADARAIAARIADPLSHSNCRAAGPDVRVCAYDAYAELARRTADAVRPVAAAVPAGVLHDVVFVASFDESAEYLQAEVQAALAGREPQLPPNALRLRFNNAADNRLAARMRLAAYAVGLPTETVAGNRPTIVAGQARGVVVLWLATRGLSVKRAAAVVDEAKGPTDEWDDTDRGSIWPGTCSDDGAVLQWAPKDLFAVGVLVRLPADRVASVLRDGWQRFTAPETSTDELLTAVGAAPVGPPERVEARVNAC